MRRHRLRSHGSGAGNATSSLVDGDYNNDPLANISQPLPSPDALQEFNVQTRASCRSR